MLIVTCRHSETRRPSRDVVGDRSQDQLLSLLSRAHELDRFSSEPSQRTIFIRLKHRFSSEPRPERHLIGSDHRFGLNRYRVQGTRNGTTRNFSILVNFQYPKKTDILQNIYIYVTSHTT